MGSRKDDNINTAPEHFPTAVTDSVDMASHGGTCPGTPDIPPGYSGCPAHGEGGTDSVQLTASQHARTEPHKNTERGEGAESPRHRDTAVTGLSNPLPPVACSPETLGHVESDPPSVDLSAQGHTTETDLGSPQTDIYNHQPLSLASRRGNPGKHSEYSIHEEMREEAKTEKEVREKGETEKEVREEGETEKEVREVREMERVLEKHHMQSQVSLEVVQSHSVATSPMTPPQGVSAEAFYFPASSRTLAVVQCHSVATSPMTPPQGVNADAFQFPASSRTLAVLQCHSVATSPMTPPQGSGAGAFPFPTSSGRTGTDSKDGEPQVGRQVEFRSVATAPMTPRTPNTPTFPAAFPELKGREMVQRTEEMGKERKPETGPGTVTTGLMFAPVQECSATTQEVAGVIKPQSNIPPDIPANSEPQTNRPCHNRTIDPESKPADDKQRIQQGPKADAFDQEITILVTHHYSYGAQEEEEDEERDEMMSSFHSTKAEELKDSKELKEKKNSEGSVEADIQEGVKVVPPVPQNSLDDGKSDDQAQPEITGTIIKPLTERNPPDDSLPSSDKDFQTDTKQMTSPSLTKKRHSEQPVDREEVCFSERKSDNADQHCLVERSGTVQPNQTEQLQRPLVGAPAQSSPARHLQHMQTQVSLEVVQCHSVATSPMTPPQGVNTDAFQFPASSRTLEVAQSHSVATSPMTPPQGVNANAFHFPASSRSLEVAQCHSVATSPMTPPQGVGAETFSFPECSRSLAVVQCHSVATSPMTPPQGVGANAFSFPESSGRPGAETKDAELQVGQQVEYRSVATAPMTPKTPNISTVPFSSPELSGREGEISKVEEQMEEEKSDEPVQEVRWDEKGMTWEVYGAVVEVAVLGSAIQKHLEKQVKKLRRQPSPTLPPPPPLNPAAMPLRSSPPPPSGPVQDKRMELDGKKDGRRRRNPFRLLLKNVQQPICCSRTNSVE
uniref:G protein-regulated inducer of neurite outgrowth C-terminal domain-containing protein n=1 Tax=Esox lucius TaxID=8010 RepID=A0A3P8YVR9_ESOLU